MCFYNSNQVEQFLGKYLPPRNNMIETRLKSLKNNLFSESHITVKTFTNKISKIEGILRNPDSDSKKTRTKRKLRLVKNPDSSLRKAGLAVRKAGLKIDKNQIRNWIQNCKALY